MTTDTFKQINNISDISHILNKDEFKDVDKGSYRLIDYVIERPDTFCDEDGNISTEAIEGRGIAYDLDGNILRRPLHKFFNVNQKSFLQAEHLPSLDGAVIMHKLDGSMICPIILDDEIIYATRMASEKHHQMVKDHIDPRYLECVDDFCRDMFSRGYSCIFEFCCPENVVVIEYDNPRLTLISVRHIQSGNYMPHKDMVESAIKYEISSVGALTHHSNSMSELCDFAKDQTGCEGYVVRYPNGLHVKIKNLWYVGIHKALNATSHDRHILNLHLEGNIDDVISNCPENVRNEIKVRLNELLNIIDDGVSLCLHVYQSTYFDGMDRSDYVFKLNNEWGKKSFVSFFALKMFNGNINVLNMIFDYMKKSGCTTTNKNFDNFINLIRKDIDKHNQEN